MEDIEDGYFEMDDKDIEDNFELDFETNIQTSIIRIKIFLELEAAEREIAEKLNKKFDNNSEITVDDDIISEEEFDTFVNAKTLTALYDEIKTDLEDKSNDNNDFWLILKFAYLFNLNNSENKFCEFLETTPLIYIKKEFMENAEFGIAILKSCFDFIIMDPEIRNTIQSKLTEKQAEICSQLMEYALTKVTTLNGLIRKTVMSLYTQALGLDYSSEEIYADLDELLIGGHDGFDVIEDNFGQEKLANEDMVTFRSLIMADAFEYLYCLRFENDNPENSVLCSTIYDLLCNNMYEDFRSIPENTRYDIYKTFIAMHIFNTDYLYLERDKMLPEQKMVLKKANPNFDLDSFSCLF